MFLYRCVSTVIILFYRYRYYITTTILFDIVLAFSGFFSPVPDPTVTRSRLSAPITFRLPVYRYLHSLPAPDPFFSVPVPGPVLVVLYYYHYVIYIFSLSPEFFLEEFR